MVHLFHCYAIQINIERLQPVYLIEIRIIFLTILEYMETNKSGKVFLQIPFYFFLNKGS